MIYETLIYICDMENSKECTKHVWFLTITTFLCPFIPIGLGTYKTIKTLYKE